MRLSVIALFLFFSLLDICAISASERGSDNKSSITLPAYSFVQFEFGTRYWVSSGHHGYDLYDVDRTVLASKLSYGSSTGQSSEVFWRVESSDGLFARGILGGGALTGGKNNDEDFPPYMIPAGNTVAPQSGGSLKYITVDLGYNYSAHTPYGLPYKIGPFVGYNNFHERYNTFGCAQVGGNPRSCARSVPTNFDTLDLDTSWNSLRVGLASETIIAAGTRVSLEAAWARNWQESTDYHNQRPIIRGWNFTGKGGGAQIEGIISHDITPKFSIGIGGRYWVFNAVGKAHVERLPIALIHTAYSQFQNTRSERFGGFLQASYRFNEVNDVNTSVLMLNAANIGKADLEPHDWSGPYVGGNTAYAFGSTGQTYLTALTSNAANFQISGNIPIKQKSDVAGFSGGGQVGYNLKINPYSLIGFEADMSIASIGGSYGERSLQYWQSTTTKTQIHNYATMRGRIGLLPRDDLMIYATGGYCYGTLDLSAAIIGYRYFSNLSNLFPVSQGKYFGAAGGFVIGTGFEYGIAKNWSLKTEWLYLGFGNKNYVVSPLTGALPVAFSAATNNDSHVIRTGINYHLDYLPSPSATSD